MYLCHRVAGRINKYFRLIRTSFSLKNHSKLTIDYFVITMNNNIAM